MAMGRIARVDPWGLRASVINALGRGRLIDTRLTPEDQEGLPPGAASKGLIFMA
jgi:hypothetical protein